MSEHARKLLIVEDDPGLRDDLKWCFESYDVTTATTAAAAITELRRHMPPVVLHELRMNSVDAQSGQSTYPFCELLRLAPHTKVIVLGESAERDDARQAIGLGAFDFCERPLDIDALQFLVDRAFTIADLETQNRVALTDGNLSPLDGIVAASDSMLAVCKMIQKIAPTDVTTLLLGESGTGKELLSRAVHRLSPRSDKKFVAINCAAIPENLLESELFGHEKGAFTGAHKQSMGRIEAADGGTLFLDEIGDMPLPLQAKLLRFLQERVVERVGGRDEIPVDVRVVCATNKDPQELIEAGYFREDLYYRISEITINIPPFRDREEGRLILARTILNKHGSKQKRAINGFSDDAIQAIEAYAWPGNVRELENKIKGAVIMADGKMVTAADLGLAAQTADDATLNLREVRRDAESRAIRIALSKCQGNISQTAALLGVTRPTLYDLINKYALSADSYAAK